MAEVKGIPFFSIKSGETRYAKSSAQIQAYINSSDAGINASRGQDFGWRLDPEWVKKVRAFRKNSRKMEQVLAKYGGTTVADTTIMYEIYKEQVNAAQERSLENENPYEEAYQEAISSKKMPEEKTNNKKSDTKQTNKN